MQPIRFITDQRYRWLSNFYGAPITWKDGTVFPTVEHGFHYLKTKDKEWRKRILKCKTPGDAKRAGHQCPMQPGWDNIKVNLMTELVRRKFQQNPDLREKLLATGSRPLEEDAHWDTFWGTGVTGGKGKGKNMMGKILKQVRRELQGGNL